MPAVLINEAERDALDGQPFFVRCLYVFGIRPHMDYRSGLVGVARGISWQSLAEALYVEPHQGETDAGTPSKARVRRAAERLEKLGLVVNRSEGKRLVFHCLLADTDHSARNKPGTNPAQTRHSEGGTHPGTPEPPSGAAFIEQPGTDPGTNPAHPVQAKPGIPPESGIREKNRTVPLAREDRFAQAKHTPSHHGEWMDFLLTQGFALHEVQSPKLIQGLREWVEKGVTVEDARTCVAYANAKCGKGRPGHPTYYLSFMPEVLQAKAAGSRLNITGGNGNGARPQRRKAPADIFAEGVAGAFEH